MLISNYQAYCIDHFGNYNKPINLPGPEEVFNFCEKEKTHYPEIRIIAPSDDVIVVQVKDGLYVFPEEWKQFNLENS